MGLERIIGNSSAKPGFHDVLFSALFTLHFVLVLTLACRWAADPEHPLPSWLTTSAKEQAKENEQEFGSLALAALLAASGGLPFLFVYLKFMEWFAFIMISLIFVGAIVGTAGGSAYCFYHALHVIGSSGAYYSQTLILAFVLLLCSLLSVIYFMCMWRRLETVAQILSAVSGVLSGLPGALSLSYVTAALSLGWMLLWTMSLVEFNYIADTAGTGEKILLNFWWLVTFFWGAAVLDGVLQIAIATIIATWYFDEQYLERGVPCCKPAVWGAFGRALTLQFGQACFGGLVLSVLRAVISMLTKLQQSIGDGNVVAKVVLCCVTCCVKCVESCLTWLTAYAYVYVAIYGVSFIKAGSEVLTLLSNKGLDMVATSAFVEPVLFVGALLGGAVGILWGEIARQSINAPAWIPYSGGFIGGFISVGVGLSLVSSGTKTLLVAYAEEPGVMRSKKPELANKWAEGNRLVKP